MITIVRLSLIVFAVGIFLPSSMAYSSMINDYTMDFDMSFLQMANRNDSSGNGKLIRHTLRNGIFKSNNIKISFVYFTM